MSSEEDIRKLPKAQLDLIDHDIYKWHCCAEGCNRFRKIRDYGEAPFYYDPRDKKFFDGESWYLMCEKHFQLSKKGIEYPLKQNYHAVDNLTFEKSVTFLGTQNEQT